MRIIRDKGPEQSKIKENEIKETSINSNHSMTKEIYSKINEYSSCNQEEIDFFEILGNYYMHESYESCLRRYIYHSICDDGKYEYCDEKGNVLICEITREEKDSAYRWYYPAINEKDLNEKNNQKNPYLEILLLDAKRRGFSFTGQNESAKKRINRSFLHGYNSEDLDYLSMSYSENHLGEIIEGVFPKGQSSKPQFAKFITDTSFILGLTMEELDYFSNVVFYEETIKGLDQLFALELINRGHANYLGYMASSSFQKIINNKKVKEKFKSIVTYFCEQISAKRLTRNQVPILIQREKECSKSMVIEFIDLLTKASIAMYDNKLILHDKFNKDLKDIFDSIPLLVDKHITQLVDLYCLKQEYKNQVEKIYKSELTSDELIRISNYVAPCYKKRMQESSQLDYAHEMIYRDANDDESLNYWYEEFRDYYVITKSEFDNVTRTDYERSIIKRRNILLLEFYKYCLSLDLNLLDEGFTNDLVKTNIDGIDISIPAKVKRFIEKANDNLKKYGFVELSFKRYMDQSILLAIWQDELPPIDFYMDNFRIKDYLSEDSIEKLQDNEYIARVSRIAIAYSQKFFDSLSESAEKEIKLDDFLKKIKLNKELLGEKRIAKIEKLYNSIKDKEGKTIHKK